jgi:hypothetical protein
MPGDRSRDDRSLDDRSAALVIRVWDEGGASGFRARLSSDSTAPGTDGREQTVALAGSPEAVIAAVRAWLDEFSARPRTGPTAPG